MSLFDPHPPQGKPLAIDLPAATFGVGRGVRHSIRVIRASLFNPSAFVGALIVQREGETDPTIVMAHIDDNDSLVVTATVVAMLNAIKPSIFRRGVPPVTRCRAVVFSTQNGPQNTFWTAAKQNVWGDTVQCEHTLMPLYSPSHPLSVVYDLRANAFVSISTLVGVSSAWPTQQTQKRVSTHQQKERAAYKKWSAWRLRYGARNSADPTQANFTGEDLVRGPAIKLFDLRCRKLKGYVVG